MRELQQKQKMKRRIYSLPVLLLLLFITFLFVRGTYVVFQKKAESASYVVSLTAEKADLDKQQTELQANIASLGTESGLEKEVKEKYNVSKPGEHVVILVDQAASSSGEATDTAPWYERVWNAIMGTL